MSFSPARSSPITITVTQATPTAIPTTLTLTATSATSGAVPLNVSFTGLLRRNDTSAGLPSATIAILVDSVPQFNTLTDTAGKYSATGQFTVPGTYKIESSFGGA